MTKRVVEDRTGSPSPGAPPGDRAGEADRLRHRIDAGKTGDKVGVSDPAAAPLGTDDEAAQPQDETGLRIAREAGTKPKQGSNS
jgi:hypothetical protein